MTLRNVPRLPTSTCACRDQLTMAIDPSTPRHEEPKPQPCPRNGARRRRRRREEPAEEDRAEDDHHRPQRPTPDAIACPRRTQINHEPRDEHDQLEEDRERNRVPGTESEAHRRSRPELQVASVHGQIENPMTRDEETNDHSAPSLAA